MIARSCRRATSRRRRRTRRSSEVRPLAERSSSTAASSRSGRAGARSSTTRSRATAAISTRTSRASSPEIGEQARRVAQCVNEIHGLGALVKDLDDGSSTSPRSATARRCCSAGSSARTRSPTGTALEDGFAGRKPLDDRLGALAPVEDGHVDCWPSRRGWRARRRDAGRSRASSTARIGEARARARRR